jgi:hypothetical protein
MVGKLVIIKGEKVGCTSARKNLDTHLKEKISQLKLLFFPLP